MFISKKPCTKREKWYNKNMKSIQIGFFDEKNRYKKLTELGDSLEKLNSVMDWEIFRDELPRVCQKEDYSKGGFPPIDVIVTFKASVLKRIYNLSYDQTKYQINDRLSFMRFLDSDSMTR